MLEFEYSQSSLGTMISFLSLILSSKRQIKIRTNHPIMSTIKQVFNIHDDQLLVEHCTVIDCDRAFKYQDQTTGSDYSKILSPYFNVESINVLGQNFPVRKHRSVKPCIGLVCYRTYQDLLNFSGTDTHWPFYRYHTMDQYSDMFQYIKRAGYEVITFDSHNITLEQKIYMLNELCDCVIGYEGGLHHVAHLLKIPSIILPYSPGEHTINFPEFFPELLHIDQRSYFPTSIDEVLSWNVEQFNTIIENLYNEQGNNWLNNSNIKFSSDFKQIVSPTQTSNVYVHDFDIDFLNNYVAEYNFFGNQIEFLKNTP
jgi:hypothetical protein